MTNKECDDTSRDTEIVDLLALHLINQILDEASVIVNAAKDSGQPWIYISSLKKIKNCKLNETYDEGLTFVISKGDSVFKYNNQENVAVTSTPQKTENVIAKPRNETSFMGQGDEDLEVRGYELRKSTSMFITHLFDMSHVEHMSTTDADVMQDRNTKSEELLADVKNIESKQKHNKNQLNTDEESLKSKSEENSSYSILNDAVCSEIPKDLTFPNKTCLFNETIEKMDDNDLALYENAYLTMNRDYEQYSEEEEEEPVLQDPKAALMHEVDLIASTSNENATSCQDKKGLNATSGLLSSGTGSRKSNIVRRCRNQGAKLLSCLKGWWWRRKLLGKRKEPCVCGSIRGLCPLSPDARRRATSLLDQRNLRTPSPSRSIVWKFNTVNEAIVNSSRWKDFDLKTNLD
ncbi:unnamed protein product [Euphydryas editha]|uniref:Uncharacterized protein n=1 Tax=Euphydryas editha TaxID=104508 RepID=A0AAU9TJ66_EUPED|nr:unnamed protein product [Euphydryas editha]